MLFPEKAANFFALHRIVHVLIIKHQEYMITIILCHLSKNDGIQVTISAQSFSLCQSSLPCLHISNQINKGLKFMAVIIQHTDCYHRGNSSYTHRSNVSVISPNWIQRVLYQLVHHIAVTPTPLSHLQSNNGARTHIARTVIPRTSREFLEQCN